MAGDMRTFTHRNCGTCSVAVQFSLDDEDRVHDVSFAGGCNGNLKGISSLIEGMDAQHVVDRCLGTTCGSKGTSCPDQLARALQEALADERPRQ